MLPFFPYYIDSFLYPILLFLVSVSKISSVLLLNVVPPFSSVPKLHFQISKLKIVYSSSVTCLIVFQRCSLLLFFLENRLLLWLHVLVTELPSKFWNNWRIFICTDTNIITLNVRTTLYILFAIVNDTNAAALRNSGILTPIKYNSLKFQPLL